MIEQRFRLGNKPGSLGVSCKQTGLALAGVPLLRPNPLGFVPRSVFEIDALTEAAYLGTINTARLMPGLTLVARALSEGDLVKAMIAAVLLKLPELDWNGAARIACADDVLAKYDPNEPRNWHGRWTTGGEECEPEESDSGILTDVAYQGTYHDQVVAELAAFYRTQGAKVLTSVDLVARNGATARADIVMVPSSGQPLILVEVKTGNDPQYTDGQMVVYPMAQIGDHVNSPNGKIRALGFAPGQWLPPMDFITIYKKDPQAPYLWKPHEYPLVP